MSRRPVRLSFMIAALCSATGVAALPGCEAISSVRGLMAAAGEVEEHLESDLKAELTDDKIDKVLEVTPKLTEFTESSKHKWKPHPEDPDFQQMATALGGLADYMAFFESHDTRLTEYYVDLIKVYDARAFILLQRGHQEAIERLETEREELQAKRNAAEGDEVKELDRQLERNELAKKKLEESRERQLEAREKRHNKKGSQYKLSDEEIKRVEDRLDEINAVFEKAGYANKTKTDKGEPEKKE